jgi:hypothetical protein
MAAREPGTVVCDVGSLDPDVSSIDALARFQLGARRLGVEVRFLRTSDQLRELLELAGLAAVLGVETGGQPEEREEPLGVEEERELADPSS